MPKITKDENLIEKFLTRGVENIYPSPKFLEDKLKADEKISIYLGIDPTGPTLHLGHAITLMKLKEWQELGHQVILLIGSFTGMIGDPTDKLAVRKPLTRKQVLDNAKKYQEQASLFLDFSGKNKAKVVFNHEWLDKLSFKDIIELASKFTVQRMLERDMFEKRMKEGKPIHLHEFLYPLMQGYDSVAMDIDGEVGGNDQTFNMLAGRDLMKSMKNKEKFVITMKLLTDPSGEKMGKTSGNMITLEDSAEDIYGKAMSYPDSVITVGLELLTDISKEVIENIAKSLKDGENPMNYKKMMAFEIVKTIKGKVEAQTAQKHFESTVQKKETPESIKNYELKITNINIVDLLVKTDLASSKSEARRLIEQGGIKVAGDVVKSIEKEVKITKEELLLQRGKRQFAKVKNKSK